MLPHYAALKVAEQFRVLDAIAPGRIDLGLGRAPGSDGRTAYALNPRADVAADQFPGAVRDLLAWVAGEKLVEGHAFRDIRAQPTGPTVPEVWILGSSDYGAQVAAHFGLPFCFAHFITDGKGADHALALYHERLPPQRSPSQARTRASASGRWQPRRRRRRPGCSGPARCGGWAGIAGCFPPCPRLTRQKPTHTPKPRRRGSNVSARGIIGTADVVAGRLRDLAQQHGVEEIAVLTTLHDPEARAGPTHCWLPEESVYGRQRFRWPPNECCARQIG